MKNIFKKIMVTALCASLTVRMLAGCGGGSGASGGVKILYSVCDNEDVFRKNLLAGIQGAAGSGVTVDVKECGNAVNDQVNDIASAEANGYDAIICRLTDAATAGQINAATNLPIIYVNNAPSSSNLKADKYLYVGSNEEQAGQMQVEYALKKLGNPKSMNIIILKGEKGHSATTGRTAAVKKALKDAGVDYNIVFSDYGPQWSPENGKAMLDAFYKTGQTVDAVFSNNDSMAMGAIESMQANGADFSKIPVMGVDATDDGKAAIKAGTMAFTVFQDGNGQGKAAVEAATALAKGGTVANIEGATDDHMYVWVPFEAVDASNVDKY